MSDSCGVCLCAISHTESWKLPCTHIFHTKCISEVYKANINRVDEASGERLEPRCPYCRARLHKKDLPRLTKTVDQNILNEPAYGSMPVDQRPYRLARETEVIRRENTRRLIDELVARRRQILEAASRLHDNQTSNSGAQAETSPPGASDTTEPIIDLASSPSQHTVSSQASCAIIEPSQNSQRSRSTISQQSVLALPSPVLQPSPELQDVQMQIGILQAQLDDANSLPRRSNFELIHIPDNDSDDSDGEYITDFQVVTPVEICRHYGRGRNIKYCVKWSDNRETLVSKLLMVELNESLLKAYKRKTLAHNTRECRRRAKERASTGDQT